MGSFVWRVALGYLAAPSIFAQASAVDYRNVGNGVIAEGNLKIYEDDAYPVTYRRLNLPEAPSPRYPGFKPERQILKSGTVRREGARPLLCDILLERDVPVTLRDGTVIYTDIFRPVSNESVPAIVAWSPYGKEFGARWLDDHPNRSGVPLANVSELQKFEGPDPVYWVSRGYAVLNPDSRGAYSSGGNMTFWGRQLAEDGYDFIEWAAEQSWSSGKVALSGNSWLTISQWFIAAGQPPHLTAIAPWEGLTDAYRYSVLRGGVPSVGFIESLLATFAGHSMAEDLPRMALKEGLMNKYWQDKIAQVSNISIPAYVVASYTNMIHTDGTFRAYRQMASKDKWLRIHNTNEWDDYYRPEHVEELTKFFDYYLKGESDNGWPLTPPVRISVLDPGAEDTVNRPVSAWPVPGLNNMSLHLQSNGLGDNAPESEGSVSYDAGTLSKGITFNYTVPALMEINNYMRLRLWVSTDSSTDMDLSVSVQKVTANGSVIIVDTLGPMGTGIVEATGVLRVSHRATVPELSTPFEPYHPHDHEELLGEGQIVPVDIGLWPMALRFHPGEQLSLTITPTVILPTKAFGGDGSALVSIAKDEFTFSPGENVTMKTLGGLFSSDPPFVSQQLVDMPSTRNKGNHTIYFGGKYDSHLLVPVNITGSE